MTSILQTCCSEDHVLPGKDVVQLRALLQIHLKEIQGKDQWYIQLKINRMKNTAVFQTLTCNELHENRKVGSEPCPFLPKQWRFSYTAKYEYSFSHLCWNFVWGSILIGLLDVCRLGRFIVDCDFETHKVNRIKRHSLESLYALLQ